MIGILDSPFCNTFVLYHICHKAGYYAIIIVWKKCSESFDTKVLAKYQEAYERTIGLTKKYLKGSEHALDIGCGTGVLLYIPDQDAAFQRLFELVKPGGYLMTASDCLKYSLSKPALQKWYHSRTGRMPFVEFYTPRRLEKRICAAGFEIVESKKLFYHPVNHFAVARKSTDV